MKKINYLMILPILFTLYACDEDVYNLWSESATRLSFKFSKNVDSITFYTFVYEPQTVVKDTIFVDIYTSGFVSKQDRTFTIEQLEPKDAGVKKAREGVHFLSFDNAEVRKHMVIKGGEVTAKLPIIILRDKSLTKGAVELRLRIKENENFIAGIEREQEKQLKFADILMKPELWSATIERYYLGPYGFEKHRFMIDTITEEKINDDFFKKVYGATGDMGLFYHYIDRLKKELIIENDRRKKEGLDILRELPKEGQIIGDPVYFI